MELAFASPEISRLLVLPLVGALAGVLGGLFGVGGGLVMIPAMLLLLGGHYGPDSLHLYKLASLASSVVVSIPAAARQARARAIVRPMLHGMLPLGVVGVLFGVALATLFQRENTVWLARGFGVFMVLAVFLQTLLAYGTANPLEAGQRGVTSCPMPHRWLRIGLIVGLPSGVIAGLLGVAGGVWAVPAQNMILGVRIRNAIANSTAMIIGLASAAVVFQAAAVAQLPGLSPLDGLWLALWLSLGGLLGGWWGAALSHRLPVAWLKYLFYALLVITGLRLAAS